MDEHSMKRFAREFFGHYILFSEYSGILVPENLTYQKTDTEGNPTRLGIQIPTKDFSLDRAIEKATKDRKFDLASELTFTDQKVCAQLPELITHARGLIIPYDPSKSRFRGETPHASNAIKTGLTMTHEQFEQYANPRNNDYIFLASPFTTAIAVLHMEPQFPEIPDFTWQVLQNLGYQYNPPKKRSSL